MDPKFVVGDHVEKTGGDYTYDGWVDCVFRKRSGLLRYVVENAEGQLFIFNEASLSPSTRPSPTFLHLIIRKLRKLLYV